MSGSSLPAVLTPTQILAAARVLVRAVLAKQNPHPAVVEAVACNVARVLPTYGQPPVHPVPISVYQRAGWSIRAPRHRSAVAALDRA